MAITTVSSHVVSVNAIQGTLIADNAITAVHIATNAVSGTLIADNAITAVHVAQNSITVTQLADDCVESDKIADGVITTNHLNKAMISSQTEVTPVAGDFVLLGDTSDSNNLKKAPLTLLLNSNVDLSGKANLAGPTFTGDVDIDGSDDLRLRFLSGSTFKGGIQVPTSTGDMISGAAVDDLAIRSQGNMLFSSGGNTERMRIDSSGNFLVGKTSADNGATVGLEYTAADKLYVTDSASSAIVMNRLASDGNIANFQKDGTTVGSIGVVSGNNLRIHSTSSGHSGLSFGTGIVYATDNAGDATNNGTDLGSSSYRWKDIHLRGGVYADLVRGYDDTDTYVNFAGSNVLSFITGASERMRIDSSGNVGIGTTPASKLHISGNSDVSDEDCQLIIDDVDSSAGSRVPSIQFRSVTGGTTTNQGRIRATDSQGMVISASSAQGDDLVVQAGKIGIGTNSPATAIHSHSASGSPELRLTTGQDSGTPTAQIGYSAGSGYFLRLGDAANNEDIMLRTYGVSSFMGGNVGIGTASPQDTLDIVGSGYDQIRIGSNFTDNTNKTAGIVSTTYTNQSVSLFQMFNQNGSNALYYGSADGAHRGIQQHYFYVNSNYNSTSGHTLALTIKSDASTCIPATKKLYLDGGSDTYIDEYSANEFGITTGGSRKFALSGGNLYHTGSLNSNHNFSDERLKENIIVIPNALEKVNTLRGITFNRKSDGSVGTGLIAQELETVLPEAVYESKTIDSLEDRDAEEYKAIRYGTTVGLLVEAIKELTTKLEAAEARIATLEG